MAGITLNKLTLAAVVPRLRAHTLPNAGINRVQLYGTVAEIAPDVTPPVIGPETPTSPDDIDLDTEISFPVTGALKVWILAEFDDGTPEVVYNPELASYTPGYTGSVLSNVYAFTRNAGWYGELEIQVFAEDAVVNEAAENYPYSAPPLVVEGDDAIAPAITNLEPTPGSTLQPTQPISFDVTDEGSGLSQVLLVIDFRGLAAPELAYNGSAFTAAYLFGSEVDVIADGFHFTLLRAGGWPAATFTLTPYPVDNRGNKA